MTYRRAIKYLESFVNFEKISAYPYKESLKLERIEGFLRRIGNPQDSLRCLHVAGTKGKGSTCAFLTYILRQAGYKVGFYTSPHLSNFRERIRILKPDTKTTDCFEGMISAADLAKIVAKLKTEIEKYNKTSEYGPLTFFEVYTAAAFVYFKEKRIDFAVLETGLGGRLDATNTCSPLACVITPISYEHTQKLGNTLRGIAAEKAGIIKKNSIVISAPQEKEAQEIIRGKCKASGSELIEVNKATHFKIRLLGKHQQINAAVAVAAIKALANYNIKVSVDSIRRGLYNTVWPGRCEVVAKKPYVVLDGAQNKASAGVLRKSIKENFKYKKLILVLGVSDDKDLKGIAAELNGLADEVILTQANNPRATKPEALAYYYKGKKPYLTCSVKEAKKLASEIAKKEDLVLVTGSLFVVGEWRDV